MKPRPVVFLAGLVLASGSGCATEQMLREARPRSQLNPEAKEYGEVPANKGVGVGVLFAFLRDVATAPIGRPFVVRASLFDKHRPSPSLRPGVSPGHRAHRASPLQAGRDWR